MPTIFCSYALTKIKLNLQESQNFKVSSFKCHIAKKNTNYNSPLKTLVVRSRDKIFGVFECRCKNDVTVYNIEVSFSNVITSKNGVAILSSESLELRSFRRLVCQK